MNANTYIAEIGGERIGGTVIVIDDKTGYNSLHLLYVNQSLLKNILQITFQIPLFYDL